MAHGHSHGGGGHGHSHGGKTRKSRKKDEDALEAGDSEHLCAEDKFGHDDDHHGHSHSPRSNVNEPCGVPSRNGNIDSTQEKNKNKKKQKTRKKNIFM